MTPTEQQTALRVLIADDDDSVRFMLQSALERDGFEVVSVMNVIEALTRIANEKFDLLLSDLHIPHAGDGFTIVTAMRHTHPNAVTLVLSGYPALEEGLAAIRLQADEVLCKPIEVASLRKLIHEKRQRLLPTVRFRLKASQTYWSMHLETTILHWMSLVQKDAELTCIRLTFLDRTGHLPGLLADLISRY